MNLDLEEAKLYLRVDDGEEDEFIESLVRTATRLVKDISRLSDDAFERESEDLKIAVLYTCAYLYEHRENADHKALTMSLRALLFGIREASF